MKWLAVIAVIFKFIGIAVLLLLAILLLVILLILLSPVKYGADGVYDDSNKQGKAFLSYLFGLVRFDIRYGINGFIYNIKIPFVDVNKLLSESEEKSEESDKSSDNVGTAFQTTEQTDNTPVTIMQKDESKKKKQKHKHKSKAFGKPKNKSKFDIASVYNKAVSFFNEYEPTKLYKPIKRFFKRFGKAVGVKTALVDATFGFDDPSLTGIVLGGCSALTAFIPITLRLSGYFEGSFLKGNAKLKGKTCLLAMLVPIIRLVLEKPVWNIITKLTNNETD